MFKGVARGVFEGACVLDLCCSESLNRSILQEDEIDAWNG